MSLEAPEGLRLLLDVRDDENDPVVLRSLYEAALPRLETEHIVFLGPLSTPLAAIAANLTNQQGALLLEPFTATGWAYSLQVPQRHLLAKQLPELQRKGARSVALWPQEGDEMCAAVAPRL